MLVAMLDAILRVTPPETACRLGSVMLRPVEVKSPFLSASLGTAVFVNDVLRIVVPVAASKTSGLELLTADGSTVLVALQIVALRRKVPCVHRAIAHELKRTAGACCCRRVTTFTTAPPKFPHCAP
jgi:hypothetical protein